MKESIANSAIFGMMIVFIVTIMLLVLSSLNYSKAFKAKNRVIDTIEKYDYGYSDITEKGRLASDKALINEDVESTLAKLGYRTNFMREACPKYCVSNGDTEDCVDSLSDTSTYLYCIYPVANARGTMYHVVTYMFWELPVVGSVAKMKVEGDTIVFYQTIDTYRPD